MGRQGSWAERLSRRRNLGSGEERTGEEEKRRETPSASRADMEQDIQNERKEKPQGKM